MSDVRQILAVIDEVDRLRETRDDAWQVPRAEAEILHHIAMASNAKLIVEVGTSYGFSGLFWAMALRQTGGHLHTIDRDPNKADASRANFNRAGVADLVTNHVGDARDILHSLPGPIDLAFLDADKPSNPAYFEIIWPKLRVGGAVVADNTTTHRKEFVDYVAAARSRPDARSTEIAVGNGIEWTIKIA